MTASVTEKWANGYDRAAEELLEEPVLAAAQFLRPRGWRAFGHAVAGGPASLVRRVGGRQSRPRLPESCLLAVTGTSVHILQAQVERGRGPIPRPRRQLAAWSRERVAVRTVAQLSGTLVTLAPVGGPPVELFGPPSELTARVVRALERAGEGAPAPAPVLRLPTAPGRRALLGEGGEPLAQVLGAERVAAGGVE